MARQSRLSHLSDEQLSNMTAKDVAIAYYNGNVGAGYNALVARGIKPKAQQEGAKNGDNGVKIAIARVTPSITAKTPASPVLNALPVRIEEWMLNHCLPESYGDDDGKLIKAIPQHFVELVVLSDDPKWNKRIRGLGTEEIEMLEAFLGNACTMNRREDLALAKRARAPFERAIATIDHHARIDAGLLSAESRFENSRYDAAIVAAYLGE